MRSSLPSSHDENAPSIFDEIDQPTLVLDEGIARRNIRRMAEKARGFGLRFRPHFKTHQSAVIGEWFREEGVSQITVSSVEMAEYFAEYGWNDILIAFPLNIRQIARIQSLAQRVHLGVLVENAAGVDALGQMLKAKRMFGSRLMLGLIAPVLTGRT